MVDLRNDQHRRPVVPVHHRPHSRPDALRVGLFTAVATGAFALGPGARAYVMHDWIKHQTGVPTRETMYQDSTPEPPAGAAADPTSVRLGKQFVNLGMDHTPFETVFWWLAVLAAVAAANVFVLVAAIVQIAGGAHVLG